MRKIGVLIILIMLSVSLGSARAEIKAESFSLSALFGGYFFEGNQNSKDSITVGARAGYHFTKNWGMEGFFHYAPSHFDDTNETNKVYIAGIEGLYHFMAEGSLVPFVAAGVGAFHYSDDRKSGVPTNFAVDYGAGVKYFLTENLALRADVRHVILFNDRYNDLLATLGIDFSFGGSGKDAKKEVVETRVEEPPALTPVVSAYEPQEAPAPAPVVAEVKMQEAPAPPPAVADADRDAIPDDTDKCPDTPAGVAVDKDGCPIDTDKDGVPDYLDKCPNTPAGIAASKDGCVYEKVSMRLNIEFKTAKYDIKKKYRNDIKKVADFMKAHPEATAIVEGHTDDVDIHHEPDRNMRLSQARADSVRKYLINEFAINADRIAATGYGPQKPIADNKTKEGRKKNRRIEVVIEAMQLK